MCWYFSRSSLPARAAPMPKVQQSITVVDLTGGEAGNKTPGLFSLLSKDSVRLIEASLRRMFRKRQGEWDGYLRAYCELCKIQIPQNCNEQEQIIECVIKEIHRRGGCYKIPRSACLIEEEWARGYSPMMPVKGFTREWDKKTGSFSFQLCKG